MTVSSAREHDFSGYGHSVGRCSHLKKFLYRHNFIPGTRNVSGYRSVGDAPMRFCI